MVFCEITRHSFMGLICSIIPPVSRIKSTMCLTQCASGSLQASPLPSHKTMRRTLSMPCLRKAGCQFHRIGIINAHIGDIHICQQQLLEHIGQDIAAGGFLVGTERLQPCHLERRLDQLAVDRIEVVEAAVAALLLSKKLCQTILALSIL